MMIMMLIDREMMMMPIERAFYRQRECSMMMMTIEKVSVLG